MTLLIVFFAANLLVDVDWVEYELESVGVTALFAVSETTLAPTTSEELEEASRAFIPEETD